LQQDYLVKLPITNKDINAQNVKKPLFGSDHTTKHIKSNTGFIFGLKKIYLFAGYVNYLAIANQSYGE